MIEKEKLFHDTHRSKNNNENPNTNPLEDFEGESIQQIFIEDKETELELLARVVLDEPAMRDGPLEIHLIRGGLERRSERCVEQRSGAEGMTASIVPTLEFGIGVYLFILEQNEYSEKKALNSLRKTEQAKWENWSEGLTSRERRLRLVDQLEEDKVDWRTTSEDGLPTFQKALEVGKFRNNRGLSGAEKRLAQRLTARSEGSARWCYKNAQTAIETAWEDNRVEYVEGLALPKQGTRAVRHAWIEIDGRVVEVTWPWHSPASESDAVYYGAVVKRSELKKRKNRGYNPMLFTNQEWEDYRQYKNRMLEKSMGV